MATHPPTESLGRQISAPADPEGYPDADRARAWCDPGGRLPSHVLLSKAGRGRCPRWASGPQAARRLPRPGWGRMDAPAQLVPSARPSQGRAWSTALPSPSFSLGSEGSSESQPPAKSLGISSSVNFGPQTVPPGGHLSPNRAPSPDLPWTALHGQGRRGEERGSPSFLLTSELRRKREGVRESEEDLWLVPQQPPDARGPHWMPGSG